MTGEFPGNSGEDRHELTISGVSIDNSQNVCITQTFNQTKIIQIPAEEIKKYELIIHSPYKGLIKFELEDKDRFFGRDQFLTGLVNELEQTNLVLLLGASGSGKSSVIRAGLIPWLAERQGNHFVKLIFTPDQDPFESLYGSLLGKYTQSEARIARVVQEDTLTQIVRTFKRQDTYWFILIDQFEELFSPTVEPRKRDSFIASLVQLRKYLNKAGDRSVKIVATMRADFLDRLAPYPALVKATAQHRPMIANMELDELRLAIEQPAAHHGVVFEPGLVKEIIDDVQGQPGYLPLLQYTLELLWKTEVESGSIQDRTLNISNYRRLGGVRGALQQHVDQIYRDLSEPEKKAAQKVFLKLVGIGEDRESGTDWKPVRQRANRSSFNDSIEQKVLAQLINLNLIVSNRTREDRESTVEVAHEALLTSWTTLNSWIKENRQAIALRNRLNEDVVRWQTKKQDDELWGGSKLEQALEKRKDTTFIQVLGGFSPIANQFIDASEGRRDRQRRRTIIGLTLASTFFFILALIAFFQYLEATKQKISAELKAMISRSELLASQGNQFDALITSLEAARKLDRGLLTPLMIDSDTRTIVTVSLQQVIGEVKESNRLEEHTRMVTSVSFSPNGKILASASQDGTVKLWNQNGKQPVITLTGHTDVVNGVSFSRDGEKVASVSGDGTIKVWTKAGELLATSKQQIPKFSSIDFSLTGEIVTASEEGTITIWKQDGKNLKNLNSWIGHNHVTFNSQGNLIASAGGDKTINLWNRKGELQKTWKYTDTVNSVSFSREGALIAGANDGKLILWNLPNPPKIWLAHIGSVNSVSFSPDSQTIASAGSDRTVKLWKRTGILLTTLQGHTDAVNSVSFSPDSQTLASASTDNTIKLWHIAPQGINRFKISGDGDLPETATISPDGTMLASISSDNTAIHVWDVQGKKENKKSFSKPHYKMTRIGWSPDGQSIVSLGEEDTVDSSGNHISHIVINLWDQKGQIQKFFQLDDKHEWAVGNVQSLRFSRDGKWVAFGCDHGTLTLWNIEMNTLKSIQTSASAVSDVAFSPDGKIIASASGDFGIKLWRLDGKLVNDFKQKHRDGINSISFSQDGQMIASASNDGSIKLWDRNGSLKNTLMGHKGQVFSVIFSPDGNLIASTGTDQKVRLWSLHGILLGTFQKLNTEGVNVQFNSRGTKVISIDKNNSVIFWNLNLNDLMQQSCGWLHNYLINNPNAEQKEKALCPTN